MFFKIKFIIIIVFVFIFLFGSFNKQIFSFDVLPINNLTINIFGTNVDLDSQLIKFNNEIYFPLREFLSSFEGSFNYNRKTDIYTFSFPKLNITAIIIPNSKEVLVNNEIHYFKNIAIEYEQQLYVPLNSFCALLGYLTEQKDNLIKIKKNTEQTLKKEKKDGLIYVLERDKRQLLDLNERLPFFESDREQYLSFQENKIYQIDQKFLYDADDILYLNFTELLTSQNFKINFTADCLSLKYKDRLAKFSLEDNSISIICDNKNNIYTTIAPVIIHKKEYYLPLVSFLTAFNYSFNWNPQKRILTLIKELFKLEIFENKESLVLNFNILEPNNFKITANENNTNLQIEFPNTKAVIMPAAINNDLINEINIDQINNNATVYLNLKNPVDYETTLKSWGLELNLTPIVLVYYQKKSQTINLESAKKIDYTINKEGNELIIDLKNTNGKINFDPLKNNDFIKNITGHRLKDNNYRITATLQKSFKYRIINQDEKRIKITFNTEKTAAPIKKITLNQESFEKTIVIDAGHGGNDPGAIAADNKYEKEFTLEIAKLVKEYLEKEHIKVILTRDLDKDITLQERVYIANNAQAKLFLSIHFNAYTNNYANGTETYYFKPGEKLLAESVHNEILNALGLRNNGIKQARLFVNRFSTIPSTTVEPLYLSNEREYNMLKESGFKAKLARAIADGILKYLEKGL
ncbi:MAG: N-acetylmuramoyl-L-alanine amidase [Candidatus Margulisiibacteriota bacterium]|jgi:N-acetylmuramoyl-L-alanine amidase